MKSPRNLIRPQVQQLHAYTPGEQIQTTRLIKLNTNENPYPPSKKVIQAITRTCDARLRLYPDPRAQGLREALAQYHGCDPLQVIIGNGSDDLLALATRAFVEPQQQGVALSCSTIQYFDPSYSLYPVLADIHGAHKNAVALGDDFQMPSIRMLKKEGRWDFKAALTYVTTPHAPSGRGYATADLDVLCRAQKGVVILDEAYADFAHENALDLALKHPHVLVSRTFSKSFALCFQRIGYFVGHPELIAALDKVRDSYNVNGLGQVAAMAALSDLPYFRKGFEKIIQSREDLAEQLAALGFGIYPSQTNFLLVHPPLAPAGQWYQDLKENKILVRWFSAPAITSYLRITVGTPDQMKTLLGIIKRLLKRYESGRISQKGNI